MRIALVALAALAVMSACATRKEPASVPVDDSPFDLVAEFATVGEPEAMVVVDDIGYIAQGDAGVDFIDLSDPSSPSRLTTWDAVGQDFSYACSKLSGDSLLYVADGYEGVKLIDLRDPLNPITGAQTPDRDVRDVHVLRVVPDTLYGVRTLVLVSTIRGKFILRESHWEFFGGQYIPFSNEIMAQVESEGGYYGFEVRDDTLFCANSFYGFRIFALDGALQFVEVGRVDLPGEARAVALDGDYAYVACDRAGLVVVDVGNPSAPSVVSQINTSGRTYDVAFAARPEGDRVYLADGSNGLRLVDVSDPAAPSIIGSYDTGYANSLTLDGTEVFVLDRDRGLLVLRHRP